MSKSNNNINNKAEIGKRKINYRERERTERKGNL
jgi:hypothetical protein